MGLCECGCQGHARPFNRFIHGHNGIGPMNGKWVGDLVRYDGAHKRVAAMRGKADHCSACGECTEGVRYEWANRTGNYADPRDYDQMCSKCHKRHDIPPEKMRMISAAGNAAIQRKMRAGWKMLWAAKGLEKLGASRRAAAERFVAACGNRKFI